MPNTKLKPKQPQIVFTEEALKQRARALWSSEYNQKAWVRSVLVLGERWLLHPSNPPAKWGTGAAR